MDQPLSYDTVVKSPSERKRRRDVDEKFSTYLSLLDEVITQHTLPIVNARAYDLDDQEECDLSPIDRSINDGNE